MFTCEDLSSCCSMSMLLSDITDISLLESDLKKNNFQLFFCNTCDFAPSHLEAMPLENKPHVTAKLPHMLPLFVFVIFLSLRVG